ncbi:MAG: DUF4142 domain-containing protein [Verrucomicrobiota bacterium]|nr:DUF4142 domain-containing protein [Verrucomicrobiota bacterium]
MKTNIMRTVVAIAALGSATIGLAADAISHGDKEFLKDASELGLTEVQLGKMAAEKGTSPDIKALGAKMMADHNKSNAELIQIAAAKRVELGMDETAAQKKMLASFEGKTGAEFDKEFREHAVKDHQKAIKTFTHAAETSPDADIKAFAAKNLPILQEHLAMASGTAMAH